jgi:xylulokinase
MSVIGLDVGTTACKAIALNSEGLIIGESMQEYQVIKTKAKLVELNPLEVWEKVKNVLGAVANQTIKDPLQAISISAMGDTVTPFDKKLQPLYNSILAFDTRAEREAELLGNKLGKDWLFYTTGMPLLWQLLL